MERAARLIGFINEGDKYVVSNELCGPASYCLVLDGAARSNNVFAILALAEMARRLNKPEYLAAAKDARL